MLARLSNGELCILYKGTYYCKDRVIDEEYADVAEVGELSEESIYFSEDGTIHWTHNLSKGAYKMLSDLIKLDCDIFYITDSLCVFGDKNRKTKVKLYQEFYEDVHFYNLVPHTNYNISEVLNSSTIV